jgi:hypothetical protein
MFGNSVAVQSGQISQRVTVMRKQLRNIQLAAMVAIATLVANTALAHADEPDPAVRKTFDKLIDAIIANNRETFVADATDAVKQGMTQGVMDGLHKHLGARMARGYQATYLCQLKQAGHQVHLWKLSFKDDGDDVVIRIALKQDKVAGFFLQ